MLLLEDSLFQVKKSVLHLGINVMSKDNDEIVNQLEKLNMTLENLLDEVDWTKLRSTASEFLKRLDSIEKNFSELDWTNNLSTASQILKTLDWTEDLSTASQIMKRLDSIEDKLYSMEITLNQKK
jgi:hypothetical protein